MKIKDILNNLNTNDLDNIYIGLTRQSILLDDEQDTFDECSQQKAWEKLSESVKKLKDKKYEKHTSTRRMS